MSLSDAATLSPGLLVRMLTLAKGLEQGADEALNPSICRTRLLGLPPDITERGGEELHQEQSLRRDASCQQGGGGWGTTGYQESRMVAVCLHHKLCPGRPKLGPEKQKQVTHSICCPREEGSLLTSH